MQVKDIIKPGCDAPIEFRYDGDGGWAYDEALNVISRSEYYVDLDRCTTSAGMLDWIMQINNKRWASPKIMQGLLNVVRKVVDPQRNLCAGGTECALKATKASDIKVTAGDMQEMNRSIEGESP